MRLPEETLKRIVELRKLGNEINREIRELTGNNFGLCSGAAPQFTSYGAHTVEEFEELVGTKLFFYFSNEDGTFYTFYIDGVECIVCLKHGGGRG